MVYCPKDIDIKNAEGHATVLWKEPEFKDNADKKLDILVQSNGKRSGDVFYEGTTNILYRAFDDFRNEQKCSFSVKIESKLHFAIFSDV